jgi:hypothetical protein
LLLFSLDLSLSLEEEARSFSSKVTLNPIELPHYYMFFFEQAELPLKLLKNKRNLKTINRKCNRWWPNNLKHKIFFLEISIISLFVGIFYQNMCLTFAEVKAKLLFLKKIKNSGW